MSDAMYCRTWLDRPARATLGDGCGGCLKAPDRCCAACGAPTAIVLAADAHALTFCRRCWRLVRLLRVQAHAESQRTIASMAAAKNTSTGTRRKAKGSKAKKQTAKKGAA